MATETGTQAIDRAAQLLVHVVESAQPVAVGELADSAGLPKSTTSRLVGALERQGLVQRIGDRGRLRPGPVLQRYAHRDDGAAALVELAEPALRTLAAVSRETVNLAVPNPLGAEHLSQRDSEHFVGVTNWVGRRVPHHVAANGKVFMAFHAVPVPPGPLERFTAYTLVKRGSLDRELDQIRVRGYAVAVDELELGLAALAAPVRGPGGEVVAALSISGPTTRLTLERIEGLAPLLLEQSAALGRRLGHHDERGAA
jgi:IclR family transcriptional regulator, acetate operon repressor